MAQKKMPVATAKRDKQLVSVFKHADARGYSREMAQDYIFRHFERDIAEIPTADLSKVIDLFHKGPGAGGPLADEQEAKGSARVADDGDSSAFDQEPGQTSERVSGKPFRKDLLDRREVERPWTQDEIEEMTAKMLAEMTNKKDIEEAKAEFDKEKNAELKVLNTTIDDLHTKLVRGTDLSEREVKIVRNFDKNIREIYDNKSGELIDTEPLTAGDIQLDALEMLEENETREEMASREGAAAEETTDEEAVDAPQETETVEASE